MISGLSITILILLNSVVTDIVIIIKLNDDRQFMLLCWNRLNDWNWTELNTMGFRGKPKIFVNWWMNVIVALFLYNRIRIGFDQIVIVFLMKDLDRSRSNYCIIFPKGNEDASIWINFTLFWLSKIITKIILMNNYN